MSQEILYSVKFLLSPDYSESTEKDNPLPRINMFLRVLEAQDRLLSAALGLEADFKRALKEMSEDFFLYKINISLNWPGQKLLGERPDPSLLREWLKKARENLMEVSGNPENRNEASETAAVWNNWAVELGLAGNLLYAPPEEEKIETIISDMHVSLQALGGKENIIFL
jgi:hypothetical protein